MTNPIQQLEQYGHEVDVITSPITRDEVDGSVTQFIWEPLAGRFPAWLAAVAVGALLLVALGGVTLLARGSDTFTAPASSASQTVAVEVSGVSGHSGDDLAGVLYEGSELSDLDRDAIGGFWTVITTEDDTTTEVIREPGIVGEGRFPYVASEALALEPGAYTLVLWVDTSLGEASRWVPVNTDGMGLFGCHYVFEVGDETATSVTITPTFLPNGWNTHCTTGATTPNTDADAPVNPNPD